MRRVLRSNNNLLQTSLNGKTFLLAIFCLSSSFLFAKKNPTAFWVMDEVQFELPGNFVAPFEQFNNIPSAGLDLDGNGGVDVIPPCSCRGTQVVQNGVNSNAAYFDDQIIIATGISGQNWKIVNAFNAFNPVTLWPLLPGTPIPEIGNTGIYVLRIVHRDATGYSASVEEQNDYPGEVFGPIENTCYYPDPVIENLDEVYCDTNEGMVLVGSATSDFDGNLIPIASINETWVITRLEDGENFLTANFNPQVLGGGTYRIMYTFDAGEDAHFSPNKTGCAVAVQGEVVIHESQTISCVTGINVTINPNTCQAEILPSMLLANSPNTYDFYSVGIGDPNGNELGNIIPSEFAGETLPAIVRDECSGITCSTEISVVDLTRPELTIPEDITIPCFSTPDTSITGGAVATDCNPVTISYSDITDETFCGNPRVEITRTWTATDPSGNTTTDVQMIYIARGDQADLRFPADTIFSCVDHQADPTLSNAAPDKAGIPNLVDEPLCGFVYTWEDDTISLCGNPLTNFIIVRTWLVLDACGVSVFEEDGLGNDNMQFIRVIDDTAPTVEADSITVSALVSPLVNGLEACSATSFIPPAIITDVCNDYIQRIYTPLGEAIYVNGQDGAEGGYIPEPGLPLGDYTITYEGRDDCGNTTLLEVPIKVEDTTTPVMICNSSVQLVLNSGGLGRIYPDDVDEASRDDCCEVTYQVKLEHEPDSLFRDFIELFCTNDTNEVVLRVTDCFGNFNICSASVNIVDPVPVQLISSIADTTITCLDDYTSFLDSTYRAPEFVDNCSFELDFEVEVNIDECGIGSITRRWTARDNDVNAPAVDEHVVEVEAVHDYTINLPEDVSVSCMTSSFPEVTFEGEACDMITTAVTEETYTVAGDSACYKILRTHQIINWCEYDGVSPPTIIDRYDSGDLDTDVGDASTIRSDGETVFRIILFPIEDDIAPSTGFYQYQQLIDVFDEEPPSVAFDTLPAFCTPTDPDPEADPCLGEVTFPFTLVDNCSDTFTLFHSLKLFNENTISDAYGMLNDLGDNNYSITGSYPVGQHAFFISLFDQCGNLTQVDLPFEVVDCTAPILTCVDNPVYDIDTSATVSIIPGDLVLLQGDNCSPLVLSFDSLGIDQMRTYDCDSLGVYDLQVWARDEAGNQTSCQVQVNIEDNEGQCIKFWAINGMVRTVEGDRVAQVAVQLSGEMNMEYTTEEDGTFQFVDVPEQSSYDIEPIKDMNPTNGVTTFDIIKITRHILSVKPLDNPYQMIAADANRSGGISAFDIIRIRQLILGLEATFSGNTSWRFVPSDYEFSNPENPFEDDFPEIESLLLTQDTMVEFIGIKVGDVNASAQTGNFMELEERNEEDALAFTFEDQNIEANQSYDITLQIDQNQAIGFQFALQFDPEFLKFEEILETDVLQAHHFGTSSVKEGILTCSWNSETSIASPRIRLRFTGLRATRLKNIFSLTPSKLAPEVYWNIDKDIQTAPLRLAYSIPTKPDFALLQNQPNPFSSHTEIPLIVPEACTANIVVYDLSGKQVWNQTIELEAGYQTIPMNLGTASIDQILFYEIRTPYGSASNRMLQLNKK